jgi:hypothetical protein
LVYSSLPAKAIGYDSFLIFHQLKPVLIQGFPDVIEVGIL